MNLIDTHSHLYVDAFDIDRDEAIIRAKAQGVKAIVLPNIDGESIEPLLSTCAKHPDLCYPLMGLHPSSVRTGYMAELEMITNLFKTQKFYGVGEVGIDFYWNKTYVEEQREAFRYQLVLAKQLKLPVVIHSRSSMDDILAIVDREHTSDLKGVFHCFSGNWEHYQRVGEYGTFMVGIGGVVTYKNGGLDKLVQRMGIERVVLETDSPYLPPVPKRGERNESSYLIHVAQKVSALLGIPVEQVATITTRNAERLFGFARC